MQVLVVEDEPRMAEVLQQCLQEEGYQALVAPSGEEGLAIALDSELDLIVLDVMLPGVDGFEVARRLRRRQNNTPILMLTARDTDADMIHGLDLGADDYVTKPFSLDVFLARVRAVSRRGPVSSSVVVRVADLEIDTATREVRRGSRSIHLTPKEYVLLEIMAKSSPRVLSRDRLIESVWGFDADTSPNNLEAFIHQLRAKLEFPGESRLIRTVRGIGYSLHIEEAP